MLFNKMITINIGGGLGNQMFQYATARCLSLKWNKELTLDTSFFINTPKNDTPRKFQLDLFNIKADTIIADKNILKKYLRLLYRLLLRPLSDDQQMMFFSFLLKIGLPVYLTRHFQKEKYFIEAKKTLIKEFTLKSKLSDEAEKIRNLIINSNSISIHVRRTDYLKQMDFFGSCSINYYTEAIKILANSSDNPTFFIFSDDIDWVIKNIQIPYSHIYVSDKEIKDYESLDLMSKCRHNIIANSTFSWWGAWLNQNKGKMIIGPKQWFKNKTSNELGIMPEGWLQLENK